MDAIVVSDVSKRFGSNQALNKVNLTVPVGEIYGFLGPNGAGKTTTIRCLMDFLRPDSGNIEVFGNNARTQATEVKKFLGYLPADMQLYDKWTAAEHIAFYESVQGIAVDAEKLIKQLDLNLTTEARHLSSGNKQKLGMVLAMMRRPKLLVLDEPTRGLDPLLQEIIYTLLREYRDAGGTVFISSHNLAEVEKICDHVGIIRAGEVVASESIDAIRQMNSHIVTIRFTKPFKPADFKADNITVMHKTDLQLICKVKGDLNPLLKKLAAHPVKDLEITHASLEDAFMEYYAS